MSVVVTPARPPVRAVADRAPGVVPTVTAAGDVAAFVGLHVACLAVFTVGVTGRALAVAVASYTVRCFGVVAGFHRYFSHRAFKAGRPFQLVLALAGTLALQRGVLWWVAMHRHHHSVADTPADVHSPHHRSLLYSHCGWFLDPANQRTDRRKVRDLERFPELVWLDRWKLVPVLAFAASLWALGPAELVWGFCVSTVALWHAVLSTGSVAHRYGGYRNYDTPDDSRNNRVIALLLIGEGWHNNHHRSPRAARHGAGRSEPDPIHAVLRGFERLGLVHDLQPGPPPPELGGSARQPSSASTSSVSAPSARPAHRSAPGVADSRATSPCMGTPSRTVTAPRSR
jgi:stearoyl-CoA desaturase (Delta-9 desaturase)